MPAEDFERNLAQMGTPNLREWWESSGSLPCLLHCTSQGLRLREIPPPLCSSAFLIWAQPHFTSQFRSYTVHSGLVDMYPQHLQASAPVPLARTTLPPFCASPVSAFPEHLLACPGQGWLSNLNWLRQVPAFFFQGLTTCALCGPSLRTQEPIQSSHSSLAFGPEGA